MRGGECSDAAMRGSECSDTAMRGGEKEHTVTVEEMQERARAIIAFGKQQCETDDPNNISLFALRLVRVHTAKEIIGEAPMRCA